MNAKWGPHGETALQLAAGRGYLSVVKALVEKKAEVAFPKAKTTPLIRAMENNQSDVVEYLIENNTGDINFKNSVGKTVLQVAMEAKNYHWASLLIKKGATTTAEIEEKMKEVASAIEEQSKQQEVRKVPVQLHFDAKRKGEKEKREPASKEEEDLEEKKRLKIEK